MRPKGKCMEKGDDDSLLILTEEVALVYKACKP